MGLKPTGYSFDSKITNEQLLYFPWCMVWTITSWAIWATQRHIHTLSLSFTHTHTHTHTDIHAHTHTPVWISPAGRQKYKASACSSKKPNKSPLLGWSVISRLIISKKKIKRVCWKHRRYIRVNAKPSNYLYNLLVQWQ